MENKIPFVSVVIPMFNSAKFISQTLESLLYQTLKDFEVVVVDDCSTDNSVAVVENFAKKFGGRLNVIKLAKNTGTPGLPRNIGIQMSRGKYVAFLDSDDLFTKTALEHLTTLAERFQADVVHLQNNFILWGGNERAVDDPAMTDFAALTNPKNFSVQSYRNERLRESTLESQDISVRVRKWLATAPNSFWATWLLFYRREFLITNQIFFSGMTTCEDAPVAFEALCTAKNYLNAPAAVNIIRPRSGSVSREDFNTTDYFAKRVRALNDGFNEFERVMKKINFFAENPNYRYAVLDWFANFRISVTLNFYSKIPPFKLNELVKEELDGATFAAYLFNTASTQRIQIMQLQRELAALKKA